MHVQIVQETGYIKRYANLNLTKLLGAQGFPSEREAPQRAQVSDSLHRKLMI